MTRCAPSSFSRPPSMPWINWYCREESSGYCLTWVCFNWCPSGCDSSFGKMLNTLFSGNVFCSGTPSSDNNSKKSVESCKICPGDAGNFILIHLLCLPHSRTVAFVGMLGLFGGHRFKNVWRFLQKCCAETPRSFNQPLVVSHRALAPFAGSASHPQRPPLSPLVSHFKL